MSYPPSVATVQTDSSALCGIWECSQTRTADRGVAYVCSGAYAGIGGGSDVGAEPEAKFGTFCSDNPLVFFAQHLGYDDTRWAS